MSPVSEGLVDSPGKEHIQQKSLYNDQPYDPPCKSEPVHVVLNEHGGGADLNGVGVIGRVLKEAIVWIEDLTREKEKELSRWSTIVETVLQR